MSILIKGMEMPTSCRACMFSRTDIRNVDWCVLTEKDLPCNCPIVPVPPHGDLIDMDVLKEWVENWFRMDRNYYLYVKFNNIPITELYDILERMPTIIPASCENPAKSRDNHEIDEEEEGE